ncbi:MAG TPA: long-chain fatty acid--CoA ligase [Bryobacteraceae bacterium]|jgi:long-chain acyl-CoA synthetase|nr:long-chain fatty acid--CoA ligase [Bryobacteraceae bacterium]
MPGRTVFTVLEETASQFGDAIALYQPSGSKENKGYRTYSWNDWLRNSREIALGLRALGLRKGDIVCILSETRVEFYLVDLGIMGAGGVAAALYTAYPMPDLARNVRDAEPDFLFVEDPKTLTALSNATTGQGISLPPNVILMTGESPHARSLAELQNLGRELLARDPKALDRTMAELSPGDAAILYLTSGATGQPKMGLTSHSAILANIDAAPVVLPTGPEDSMLVFLPSAHIAQRIVLELVPMRMGTPVWFSESLSRLPGELKTVRPTIFLAPPRVWEKMYATILNEIKKRPAWARKMFHGALGLGLEAARYKQEGKPLPAWLSRMLKIADKLVFSKVRARLGGRIRIAASGAAPLGRDLAEFFTAINLPLIEGYGLTEAGVISFNPLDRPKAGSVGKLLPGVNARIAEDGELQVRTPCLFIGYYKDEEATRSVMTEDGWFATGDIAEVDSDGYWYITGRKKELIVSSNGKKIYPAKIENLFKMEPIINQVVLIGDKKPYVTAILTLNTAQLKEAEPVNEAVQAAVTRVNKQLADFERIRRFKVLERDFSIDQGELTPTMKIRRARVLENHRELVSDLYLGRDDGQ